MTLAQLLWQENRDLAQQALDHPFMHGIRYGTLPYAVFQHYLAQDAFFLNAYARAYALALVYAPDTQGMRDFYELLSGVFAELTLHERNAKGWDIDLTQVVPDTATLAYTDFLLATATLRDIGEICAAMTPCMRLYAFLGQMLAFQEVTEAHPYRDWIHTYAAPEFEALAVRLETLLDRYASDIPPVHTTYRRAMQLEVAFFSAQAIPSTS
ncbi:thiaminase/transcriptional activator TenA [Thermosporothrix hazakensis]|jgi:thiaminase/transcriptional activator TenA|uniref:Thiaminase/transcriptional activator TenA n=1 Tax=Thermosporothrix hazakensis TaxID=644383 RepID=A0A326UDL7_THEHA|nr:TenA family protein [Thermosporothrix hazakensis]PZW36527.1 thiaminase/transcriptional activator TenA [Thermosporothrix hazakensis]GCE47178.1 aminopyrimidine aminohydrolase [Thermosporothrix hazakensis]